MTVPTALAPAAPPPLARAASVCAVELVVHHEPTSSVAEALGAVDLGPFRLASAVAESEGATRTRFVPARDGLVLGDRNVIELQHRVSQVARVTRSATEWATEVAR
jgi:hypothetical protein